MSKPVVHKFGIVDDSEDLLELHWEVGKKARCRLESLIHTERGLQRDKLASIPASVWRPISQRVFRELAAGMGENERKKRVPTLKRGINQMGVFIGRELAVLLWALMEAKEEGNIEAILLGWRELAREERWWLYAKAAAPGQRAGIGWRLALFHALSETTDSRVAGSVAVEKKSPGNGCQTNRKSKTGKKPEKQRAKKATQFNSSCFEQGL